MHFCRFNLRILMLAALCLFASACGETSDGPERLNVWTPFAAEPMNSTFGKIIDGFNAKHQGSIVAVHTPFDSAKFDTVVKTSFLGGSPPDVVFMNPGGIMFQYAEAGLLLDITKFVDERKNTIADGIDDFYAFNGKSYGIPFQLNVGNLLYYNKDLLAAFGIKEADLATWQGFLAACQIVKKHGVWPIAFGNLEGWPGNHLYNHLLLRTLGPEDYVRIFLRTYDRNVANDVNWNDEDTRLAWQMYVEVRDLGYFSPGYLADNYATANSLFLTGRAAFFINGSWFAGDLASKAPDLNWGVMPFPVVNPEKSAQMDLVISGLVASISRRTEHQAQALEFLEYLMSEPVQRLWAESNQRISPYKFDQSRWRYSSQFRQIVRIERDASKKVLFGDMIEDFSCNKPWLWDASQGILIDSIDATEIGTLHEKCVERVRHRRGFN